MFRWILANVGGEGAAMGVSALLGALFSYIPTGDYSAILFPLLMVLTGFAEGCVVGAAQASVLKVPRWRWTLATGAAFALAWGIGAAASFFEPADVASKATLLVFAGVAGAGLGALVGLAQSRVEPAPELVRRTAAAWACALMLLTITADLVPYGPFTMIVLMINVVGGLIAGAAVGLVSWGALAHLLRDN